MAQRLLAKKNPALRLPRAAGAYVYLKEKKNYTLAPSPHAAGAVI